MAVTYPKTRAAAWLCCVLGAPVAHGLVINQEVFLAQGGDLADIAGSLKYVNNALREQSFSAPYLSVGKMGGCTATWIGDDEAGWSYILTAAHCVSYKQEVTPYTATFTAWNGSVIASGAGTAYVPKVRVNRPPAMGGASTDIAVVKLPKKDIILDEQGQPIAPPVLYDGSNEVKRAVQFVGYGTWGVGLDQNGSYGPATGPRRLYGESVISGVFELAHGIEANYVPKGKTTQWARTAPGDSGSAWWQQHEGMDVIIATTNGGAPTYSTGARVSQYTGWVAGIYPQVRLLSKELAKEKQGCITSLRSGAQYCLPVGQRSGYTLPAWINEHEVEVNAAPGTKVLLSDWSNLSYSRVGEFVGTVAHDQLKQVKAWSGQVLDFHRPRSMRVSAATTPVGCIVSLRTRQSFCLPAGKEATEGLPAWIDGEAVYVKADAGVKVVLSDVAMLPAERAVSLTGVVEAQDLRTAQTAQGVAVDVSRPRAMRVTR